ncbi:MAG TPA: alpha/beta hydrolase [Polyangiaceae bacterium]|nr:alpha/beta hydrolase [Polyangiaceae bacterium]
MRSEAVELATITLETARGGFAVRIAGQSGGPLVVCLHGFADDARTFDALLARLTASGMRAVAPWLRGYAPSPLQGPVRGDELVADVLAFGDALAPGKAMHLVGHGVGAQIVYRALARAPARFERAVTLGMPHPAAVAANALLSPAQAWRSAYLSLFRVPRLAEWVLSRHNFAYVERLWRKWSPGFDPPRMHLQGVKLTLMLSLPAPLAYYRDDEPPDPRPIRVPTLCLLGERDGCVAPELGAGQERFFKAPLVTEVIGGAGHFLHLERPELVGSKVANFLEGGRVG